jgi:hypothetical protein
MTTDITLDHEALEARITATVKRLRKAIGPKANALHADAVMKAEYRAMDRASTMRAVAAAMDDWCQVYRVQP